MTAFREFKKVKNNILNLPKEFENKEVEVIILPRDGYEFWSEEEIKKVGKIGMISSSFEDDEEDYSRYKRIKN